MIGCAWLFVVGVFVLNLLAVGLIKKDRGGRIAIHVILSVFLIVTAFGIGLHYDRPFTDLRNGAIYTTILQENVGIHAYLYLRDIKDESPRLFKIEQQQLLDENGKIVTEVPSTFKVIRGEKIAITEIDEFHQKGKLYTVYYLISPE